jgi:HAD superfamily hydrolase (TIGR01509 family)
MLKAILLDMDGTLANTDPVHLETWQDLLQPYGIEVTAASYPRLFSGRRNQEILRDILPHLTAEAREQFSQQKEAAFRERATRLPRMPGLTEFLGWATDQGLIQAVVTNAPRANAEFMLQVLGLERYFPVVIIGDELPAGKPDPLPYKLAAERLGVLPEEAVAFEDSVSGVRSAVAAGNVTIGVASTHDPRYLLDAGASFTITDFSDPALMPWLEQQLFGRDHIPVADQFRH